MAKINVDNINRQIMQNLSSNEKGMISDGYHTFDELYEFRKLYNAALFNEWALQGKHHVHKSKRHYDGEVPFGGGYFIVTAVLPAGQISNHYLLKDWNLFKVPEYPKSLFEFDGHTSEDVTLRLRDYIEHFNDTKEINL